jgi:Transposase DDE domain
MVAAHRPQGGPSKRNARKHLSADALHALLRSSFSQLPDPPRPGAAISLTDTCLSAFAMFALKDPSLLAFDARRNDQNMKNLYGIQQIPCDTQMRKILDPLDPLNLRPSFNDVLRQVQRGKGLEPFVFHQGCYLLALDGTGYFSSPTIHCDSCLRKENSQTGEITYSHQLLGAALVHPQRQEVIPLAPEPIVNGDGQVKNDCERNAAPRLLERIRAEHPHLKLIVIEDALSSNAPHIRDLLRLDMHYILGVKPGDHGFLFDRVIAAMENSEEETLRWRAGQRHCEIVFLHNLPVNESNQDLLVNYLQYSEYDADGERTKHFSWVTDLPIARRNARELVRGGRARWKIENETFNTLKNQGYHFEHNYGHGKQHLSVVFAMIMMLAFLVDQVQQLCCPLFCAVWQKFGSKRALWDRLRSHVLHFIFESMRHLYEVMLHDLAKEIPAPKLDTS